MFLFFMIFIKGVIWAIWFCWCDLLGDLVIFGVNGGFFVVVCGRRCMVWLAPPRDPIR